jgi:hypothetical protein
MSPMKSLQLVVKLPRKLAWWGFKNEKNNLQAEQGNTTFKNGKTRVNFQVCLSVCHLI